MNNLEGLRKNCEDMMNILPLQYAYIPASSIITLIERIEKAEAELSAANEKLSKPVVLPDGWRIAPIKPTKAMIDAFRVAYEHDDSYADHWVRMLAAAPKPAGFTVEGE